jgi:hypothetical protein
MLIILLHKVYTFNWIFSPLGQAWRIQRVLAARKPDLKPEMEALQNQAQDNADFIKFIPYDCGKLATCAHSRCRCHQNNRAHELVQRLWRNGGFTLEF